MNCSINDISTPCYIVDEESLKKNLETLAYIRKRTGCKILLALKGFAMFRMFPLISRYLDGVSASSRHEARLGMEKFGKEVHVFSPAYSDADMAELPYYSDHMIFNSFSQWRSFKNHSTIIEKDLKYGIRINPEYSEVEKLIYNPCAEYSRLGVTEKEFEPEQLEGISGLHFHALCEQNSDTLERVLAAAEEKFGTFFRRMEWVNFGGGHHITRKDYDTEKLCNLITGFRKKYNVKIYLEPGEAVVLNAGVLVASVLDIVHNKIDIAILDTSAATHMPDVLEMPYKPGIEGAGEPGAYDFTYRLGGPSCLAGDVIGDYSFPRPLKTGDKLVFNDMAHYTMVKNNTFNGVPLPSIGTCKSGSGEVEIVKTFGYRDYCNRLS